METNRQPKRVNALFYFLKITLHFLKLDVRTYSSVTPSNLSLVAIPNRQQRIFNPKTRIPMKTFLLLFLLFAGTIYGQKTYTGANGSWNTAGNWTPSGVPTASDAVIIPFGKTVNISANAAANSLLLSGNLTMNNNLTLTISNDYTVDFGGTFILPGGSATGCFVVVYGNYYNNGLTNIVKHNLIIAGNLESPSPTALQNQGNVVVGGNVIGAFDLTGGTGTNQIYALNPNAIVNITPSSLNSTVIPGTQLVTPTESTSLYNLVNNVIYGTNCSSFSGYTSNVEACVGTNATFTVSTTAGTPRTFQWQRNINNGAGWSNISGQTGSTLTVTSVTQAMNHYRYRVAITYSGCVEFGNYGELLTFEGVESPDQAICSGSQPADISLSGISSGTIQWQSSTDNVTFNNISGATSATLAGSTIGAIYDTSYFRAIVTGGTCSSSTSGVITVNVGGEATVSANQTICSGSSPSNITLTGTGLTSIQWQSSTDNISFTNISGATSATLTGATIGSLSATRYYRATYSFSTCTTGISPTVRVTVNPTASIASVTGTSSLCVSGTATFVANSIVLGGGTGAWSSSNNAKATVSAVGLVTGVEAGTVNIIYTITGGCGGTKTAQQSVTISAPTTTGSVTQTQCGGNYTWPVNGVTYSSSTTQTVVSGCNTATLNLTITTPTTTGSVTQTQCGGTYTWPVNGVTYSSSTTQTVVSGCNTATLNLTITPTVTPSFTQVVPICAGSSLSTLPTTSNNNIIGSWSPALNTSATTTYTFTPNSGQCANTTSMTITVNECSGGGITKLRRMMCGRVLPYIDFVIQAVPVALATKYRFEITDDTSTREVTVGKYYFNLFDELNGSVDYNKTYYIRVQTLINGSWGTYGDICSVTTPNYPLSKIITDQCGTIVNSLTPVLIANRVRGATKYSFKVTNGVTTRVVETTNNYFNATQLLGGYASNTIYTIEVATLYKGNWSSYGSACTITTPAAPIARMVQTEIGTNVFEVKAFPNPFARHFSLAIQSSSDDLVQVRVYDMIGRELEVQNATVSELSTKEIGTNHPSGVYNVIVSQGDKVRSVRMIKR